MGKSRYVRLACVSAAALLSGLSVAQAGGYAVREQSTQFEGTSFAGSAAGGDLSSMFWNPAATASLEGVNFSSNFSFALTNSSLTAAPDSAFASFLGTNSGSFSGDFLVPATYANYQLSDRWYLGLALNSPFGFATKPSNTWAGSPLEDTSKIFTIDINPTIAYKFTPQITIGAGLQVEYFKLRENSGPVPSAYLGFVNSLPGGPYLPSAIPGRSASVDDWGVGATAGVIWQPTALTSIGLGYRSPVEVNPSGTCSGFGLTNLQAGSATGCASGTTVHASTTLPETLTLSGRQQVTERLALLGTLEWTHWSRVQPTFAYNSAGIAVDSIPVGFKDGWFYALGAEYMYNPRLTLRAGLSYEKSPVTDENRTQFLPDSDRWTPSVGASYKWSDRITIDLAYSHIFFSDGSMKETVSLPIGTVTLLDAVAKTDVDFVSVGLKYKLAGPATLEPFK